MLLLSLLSTVVIVSLLMAWQYRQALVTGAGASRLVCATQTPPSAWMSLWLLTAIVVISGCLYAVLGRYPDHHNIQVNNQLDYLLREQVQQMAQQPQTAASLEHQASLQQQLGDYAGAAITMTLLIDTYGEQANWLGQLATFQYYRDGRLMIGDTSMLVARALALEPAELNSQMLLANQAFLSGDYAKAISHWDLLLAAAPAGLDRSAIERAKTNAETRLAQ
ncbi:hypothetical protein [Ferrimonas senticii]|uniref:hypothetical protein n=1 Tax=Ferrimonas senticii TaxID=394566 RepID=UPI0004225A0C|nr:hypothetical protein [Ferrimonas senticii]